LLTYSEKREHSVILAVTIGSILEWYEIYLYIFWSPILSSLFFSYSSETLNLIGAFLVFAIGFLTRPLGGIIFGRIGDLFGRKKSLILSIIIMAIPSFAMGLLPTYEKIGVFAPIILGLLRLLQALPSGGELPGAFCYLYESTPHGHRRYMTSWGVVGQQIGIIISMLECFLLEQFLSRDQLIAWGWRFSFVIGGCIALFGFYLRNKLHETPLYKDMERHRHAKQSISEVFRHYKTQMGKGILFCLLNSVGFYLISILFPVYFTVILGINYDKNLIISIALLLLTTIPLPFIGMLGDHISNKKILIFSTILIILLLYPLYILIPDYSAVISSIVAVLFILAFTCLSALIPYRFAVLFPTTVRYTCVGISYNIVDGILGGFSPVIALIFLSRSNSQASCYWILLISAVISLASYFLIDEKKENITPF
jgi:MHS family proline/betaine transporter-like MFS transporter